MLQMKIGDIIGILGVQQDPTEIELNEAEKSVKTSGDDTLYKKYIKDKCFDTFVLPQWLINQTFSDTYSRQYFLVKPQKSILHAVIYILDQGFKYLTERDQESYVKILRQTMSSDIDRQNLFHVFNYQKNRSIKKGNMQKLLLDTTEDIDVPVMHKFIVDYFGINLLIFSENKEIEHILSTNDTLIATPYKPAIMIIRDENGLYQPILNMDGSQFTFYPESELLVRCFHSNNLILNAINKSGEDTPGSPGSPGTPDPPGPEDAENPGNSGDPGDTETDVAVQDSVAEVTNKNLMKLKLKELQKMATDVGINIKRKSDQTGNMIAKTKKELIDDLSSAI